MSKDVARLRRPRCILVYAIAPAGLSAAEANRRFNEFLADRSLPLPVFHDHFIGEAGGVAIVYAETENERAALIDDARLEGWRLEFRPLVFSHSPAAFDEQTSFTLDRYRGVTWSELRLEERPRYGSASREADTAQEDDGSE